MEVFGYENMKEEHFIDVLVQNGYLFKRYYSKINNMERSQIELLIDKLIIDQNFIIDKLTNEKIELIDSKTGEIRYCIWNDSTVEKYFMMNLGLIINKGVFL